MKQISRKIIIILLICITVLSGCVPSSIMIQHSNSLSSIAYKNETMSEEDYTVMIKERGEYVPYLVITDNYDGSRNCLLLRKYLLDDYFRFNEDLEVSSYYKTCELGNYLDEEYIKIYSNELQDIIVNTDIEITSYLGLISCKNLKEHINRKVFLLSYNELCKDKSSSICAEGNAISYFEDKSHAVAVKANGEEGAYWLRTPDTWFTTVVCAIDTEGTYFSSGTSFGSDDYELGVRPAFCLPRNTQIIEEDGVYYIEADYNSPDLRENAEDRTEMHSLRLWLLIIHLQ